MLIESTTHTLQRIINSEAGMLSFGASLGEQLRKGTIIYISGELGAGKTTLCRAILSGRGHHAKVKSPTYTLVEPYNLPSGPVYHFDLYRLADPSELEYMGYRDYLDGNAICLVEWPEKGVGWLPEPDIKIGIAVRKRGRNLECQAQSKLGINIINNLYLAWMQR